MFNFRCVRLYSNEQIKVIVLRTAEFAGCLHRHGIDSGEHCSQIVPGFYAGQSTSYAKVIPPGYDNSWQGPM